MKMRKYLSALLALVLLLSALPFSAAAATTTIDKYDRADHIRYDTGPDTYENYNRSEVQIGNGYVIIENNTVVSVSDGLKGQYPVGSTVLVGAGGTQYYHTRHVHSYDYCSTRSGHGLACWCGAWKLQLAHDDPLTAEDGRCHCGYKFYDNAQITVLWMRNVTISPRFTKDKYEYTGKLTKDVDEITLVTVKLFDQMATLEEPASYKLKPGTNVFEFTVTAEDQKTTQTYTVTIEK